MERDEALAPLLHLDRAVGLTGMVLAFATLTAAVSAFSRRIDTRPQQQLGPYVLEEKIGEGGMGTVYRARHALLKRPTAVKVLKPEIASPATIARFQRKVQLACRLEHPNTVEIFDYGRTAERTFYFAMELLRGIDLARLVSTYGPLPTPRAVHILRQVCWSLREAHRLELVHRDVKPQNVMLCIRAGEADVVKVLDFGLIEQAGLHTPAEGQPPPQFTGTPRYMPPERILHPEVADVRSDIYGIGAVAYWLLTGRELFEANNVLTNLQDALVVIPEAPSRFCTLPEQLEQLIFRCLAKVPEDRPQSVDELLTQFDEVPLDLIWTSDDAERWWREHLPDCCPETK